MKIILSSPIKSLFFFVIGICLVSCNNTTDLITDFVLSEDKEGHLGLLVSDDHFETSPDYSIILDVLSNDKFTETEEVRIVAISSPLLGKVKINRDNTITYTPRHAVSKMGLSNMEIRVSQSPAKKSPTEALAVVTPAEDKNVTDTFSYTTEIINGDATVRTEIGTVAIVFVSASPLDGSIAAN